VQTIPSTYIFGNDLGSNLGTLVDELITDDLQTSAFQAINATLIVDPRIIQVTSVNVQQSNSGLVASIAVEVIGQGTVKTTVPIGGV
jgi:phage baseplate assembly protein W